VSRINTPPEFEAPEPLERDDVVTRVDNDSEIDFDDERDDDQLPADAVEELEAGTNLDDPESLSEDDEDE
jgi:hypothetical protein